MADGGNSGEGGGFGCTIKPEMYNGERNPAKAERWWMKMKVFLGSRRKETPVEEKLIYIELQLEDKAYNWMKKRRKAGAFETLEAFEKEFEVEYIAPKAEDRVALSIVKQQVGESVKDFGDRVEMLTSHTQVMEEATPGVEATAYDIRVRPSAEDSCIRTSDPQCSTELQI
eukprot:GHVU01018653.1.p1 GENE.GHVU01018653.1~~GHVU01018653.1.p1  ORF type:complete len:171 (+),score=34.45 GHVU01018653.1:1288-1800(+)